MNDVKKKTQKMVEDELEKMTDDEVIKAGYCPECYSKLQFRGGCKECPNGCVGFCG